MQELLLRCKQGGSDKEYRFVIDPSSSLHEVQKFSGSTGHCKVSQGSINIAKGQGRAALCHFVESKLKKGYRPVSVNGKPWMGGSSHSLVSAFIDGFVASGQAPVGPRPVSVPVPVAEFDEGAIAPVW